MQAFDQRNLWKRLSANPSSSEAMTFVSGQLTGPWWSWCTKSTCYFMRLKQTETCHLCFPNAFQKYADRLPISTVPSPLANFFKKSVKRMKQSK